ncbi:MAG: lysophospholipid acyltransferase family protein [Wenzhouxiangella sp.]|jgi:KDO2-lipid IV(A) lauroyltransferase|nr:lysophospholipid acyltransferase family protein [Wenzhouxiangella sp.]
MLKTRRWVRRAGFHFLRILARVSALGGYAGVAFIGEKLGAAHYHLGGSKRRQLLSQMARVLPERADAGQIKADLKQAYRVNDRAILEILAAYSGALPPAALAGVCTLENHQVLDKLHQLGSGVILLGMHMGNGVALAIHLAHRGYPVSIVYRESNKIRPQFFAYGIERNGMNAIPALPASAGFRQMLRALKGGGILFILMDQASKRGGVETPFLGKTLAMPPGPVELARRTNAPIVPVRLREARGGWRFRLGTPIRLDNAQTVNQQVKMLSELMEAEILSHPQWWTWHQRRWLRHPFSQNPDTQNQ